MSGRVAIVDYGLGNLHSVAKALRLIGADFFIATRGEQLAAASAVILPGVGAFRDGMLGLQARGHDEALKAWATQSKPLLGICLGAQLLLEESDEFGVTKGLGLIAGRVEKISGPGVKVPHVGWGALLEPQPGAWAESPLAGLGSGCYAYFVHSFQAVPARRENLLATVRHGGYTITAAVRSGSLMGFQFHPEKSGQPGLEMLKKFIGMDDE